MEKRQTKLDYNGNKKRLLNLNNLNPTSSLGPENLNEIPKSFLSPNSRVELEKTEMTENEAYDNFDLEVIHNESIAGDVVNLKKRLIDTDNCFDTLKIKINIALPSIMLGRFSNPLYFEVHSRTGE